MSLLGVQHVLQEAESNVSLTELGLDVDLEVEDHSEEIWNNFSPIDDNRCDVDQLHYLHLLI